MSTQVENLQIPSLEALQWRYATKRFDADRKIDAETLTQLLAAIRLAPSSYGLQPYRVLVVESPEIREKLRAASWNQPQLTEASHVLVFAHRTAFGDELIDSYLRRVAHVRDTDMDNLKGYGDFMKSKLLDLPDAAKNEWTARQAYIALGNLMYAAAEARVDTCPMEGFELETVNEILDLPAQGYSAAVIATIGYRSEEDVTQHYQKVRRTEEELFEYL
ncbi:NAD(P)H-dependent oxidoreductase [Robiginitalea sp. M366]|uniref:NAD(P)H-dependent oxidoreductase n=1 Tax=Robiginitalea aestuariiviva TaxID=3036903 RepID=UPI00240D49A1|nr:NAD(P)H-dependent oxidoreductase [Robiginitalea aestuariiviva]MDG1570717.1 NAD(P)H-dependent oxidoreductase [Robiginitalea aestuariiviva]